jgi:hypothetical protein
MHTTMEDKMETMQTEQDQLMSWIALGPKTKEEHDVHVKYGFINEMIDEEPDYFKEY